MTCKEKQVKLLMKYIKTMSQEVAAAKAGMSLRSARNYIKTGGPQLTSKEWKWRQTHPDAFATVWEVVEEMLRREPGLQARTILQWLIDTYPDQKFAWKQLRTLQRRIRRWRALSGPDKEVMFAQNLQPGKQSQSDWTNCNDLKVTIQRRPFPHNLLHFMLPFSRWETAFISQTESFDNLVSGFIKAVSELGGVAAEHRTDNLTAAVNNHGNRPVFNESYSALLSHYDVSPSKNNPGQSHENGSVEKSHDILKSALRQALSIRGSRDFSSQDEYEVFLKRVIDRRNSARRERIAVEVAHLKPLPDSHWNDPKELRTRVTSFSTVSVDRVLYSVPSRLIGRELRVLLYPEVVRFFLGNTLVQETSRLEPGSKKINYRHVISQLVRKPNAFANYQHREELFPSVTFRRAYDAWRAARAERADREYLKILNLAAMNSEQDVETALVVLLDSNHLPDAASVRELIQEHQPQPPELTISAPDLCSYDSLLLHLTTKQKETL